MKGCFSSASANAAGALSCRLDRHAYGSASAEALHQPMPTKTNELQRTPLDSRATIRWRILKKQIIMLPPTTLIGKRRSSFVVS
jgi:hypothetical protein